LLLPGEWGRIELLPFAKFVTLVKRHQVKTDRTHGVDCSRKRETGERGSLDFFCTLLRTDLTSTLSLPFFSLSSQ